MATDELRQLFVGLVDAGFWYQMIMNGLDTDASSDQESLDQEIRDRLLKIATLERSGHTFDHLAYSKSVLEMIQESSEGGAGKIFIEYCHFQDRISMLESLPDIKARLLEAGLNGPWARLQVDRQTLRTFSLSAIEAMGRSLTETKESKSDDAVEVATHIWWISDLFGITIDPTLQALVDWYMDNGLENPASIDTFVAYPKTVMQ